MNYVTVQQALALLPVRVSERRFRTIARRLGCHRLAGRQMMVRAEDIEEILEAMIQSPTTTRKRKVWR